MAIVETKSDPKDNLYPLGLLAAGLVIMGGMAAFRAGPAGLAVELAATGVYLAIMVVVGLAACFLAAKLMGIQYGTLGSASLKLAAIFIFPGAVSLLIPWACLSWLVSLVIYWGLIEWLFELNPVETVVTVLVIFAVNLAAIALVIAAGLSLA